MKDKQTILERRPTYAEISLGNLDYNFSKVRESVGKTKIIAIVKADAYGHGLLAIAERLEMIGTDYLGVGFLEEGVVLREQGIKCPILVLGGVAGYQINYFLEYNLELTASSQYIISEIDRRAGRMNKKARVHLKIDTGMNRIGVNYKRAEHFFQFSAGLANIEVVGIYSHLAVAEDDMEFTQLQYQRLMELQAKSDLIFKRKIPFHLLNSAGIMNFSEGKLDIVRPGLMLYGMSYDEKSRESAGVKPLLTLKSEVVFIKQVSAGEGISYGLTHRTAEETTIATVPIGYGDGYPHRLSNCGQVLIGGKRYPVVGRVCMDQIMVDVGKDRIRIGQDVVLIGTQDGEVISVEEICRLTGALPYEITIGLTERVPRLYLI